MYPVSYTGLTILIAYVLVLMLYGMRQYSTPLNPLTFYLAFDSGLRVILSCIMLYSAEQGGFYTDDDIAHALFLQVLYVTCFALPFLLRPRWLQGIVRTFADMSFWRLPRTARRISGPTTLIIMALLILCVLLLAVVGNGGLLWLTNPREAYQNYKLGAGNYYLMWVWTTSFLLAYVLFFGRPTTSAQFLRIAPIILFVLASSYFTGSKQILLANLLLLCFYYTHYVKMVRATSLGIIAALLLALFLGMQLIQGTTSGLKNTLAYFDYFQKTIELISRYNEIGPKFGEGFLSSFWGYIPRQFFTDKPLIYGQLMIQDALYPHAAEQGYYPAFAPWAFMYIDFGALGIVLSGIFSGALSWSLYEIFRNNRENFFLFTFALQATITLYMVPLHGEFYLLAWFVLQRLILSTNRFGLAYSATRPRHSGP